MATEQQHERHLATTGQYLDDAHQLIVETGAVSANITTNLAEQRDVLGKVQTDVATTREDAEQARSHLASLKRKHLCKMLSLYFIVAVLSAHIIFRVFKCALSDECPKKKTE